MGIVLMNILHHFLRTLQTRLSLCLHLLHICRKILGKGRVAHLIYIIWILEFHRIPVGIASPILPVLHDGIGRNLQFTILVQYARQFIAGLIALAALPEAHRPFREHRSLSGQLADAGDDSILCTILVHKIVVGTGSYFTGEGSTGRLTIIILRCYDIIEISFSRIVPVKTIAFLAGEIRDGDISVIVPEYDVLTATLIHMNITQLSQTIDGLVVGKTEVLLNAVLALVGFILAGFQTGLRIGKQQLSILRKEADFASLLVQFDANEIRFNIYNISIFLYLNILQLLRLQDDRIAFLLNGSSKSGI